MAKDETEKLRGQAYTAAQRRLREEHKREFNTLLAEEMANRGIEWQPKLTDEEKAEQDLERLLEEHPHLRERLTSSVRAEMEAALTAQAEVEAAHAAEASNGWPLQEEDTSQFTGAELPEEAQGDPWYGQQR